jgi:hypothetical protein
MAVGDNLAWRNHNPTSERDLTFIDCLARDDHDARRDLLENLIRFERERP